MLKLMYITNKPEIARIAESTGVDRIFVDLEQIGKKERQGGMDTVQSFHTLSDVAAIRSVVKEAELLVRCNLIHDADDRHCGSAEELESILQNGADMIMLPYFKHVEEVRFFLEQVKGRAKTNLLIETPEAVEALDEILSLPGIDEVHIGINDLSLGYHKPFMFELFADGTVERLCAKFREAGIPYGIGGVAALGRGVLPADYIIAEHYRLGSSAAILSRSFCNVNMLENIRIIQRIFRNGMRDIRAYEEECMQADMETLLANKQEMDGIIRRISGKEKAKGIGSVLTETVR